MSETAAPNSYLIVEEYIGVRRYWIRANGRVRALKRWAGLRVAPPPMTDEVVKVIGVEATPYVPGSERKAKPKATPKRSAAPA